MARPRRPGDLQISDEDRNIPRQSGGGRADEEHFQRDIAEGARRRAAAGINVGPIVSGPAVIGFEEPERPGELAPASNNNEKENKVACVGGSCALKSKKVKPKAAVPKPMAGAVSAPTASAVKPGKNKGRVDTRPKKFKHLSEWDPKTKKYVPIKKTEKPESMHTPGSPANLKLKELLKAGKGKGAKTPKEAVPGGGQQAVPGGKQAIAPGKGGLDYLNTPLAQNPQYEVPSPSSPASFWKGKKEAFKTLPTQTPMGQDVLNRLMSGGYSQLQDPYRGFEDIANLEKEKFASETVPGLANRFLSLGRNRMGSSGFTGALGAAATGLHTQLAAQKFEHGMKTREMALNQIKQGLAPQFEIFHRGAQQPGYKDAINSAIKGAAAALTMAAGL